MNIKTILIAIFLLMLGRVLISQYIEAGGLMSYGPSLTDNYRHAAAYDLVDHCCEAWNKLVDQPWRIMSLGLRQWAHEF
jgi:hypothetical protein